MTLRLLGGFVTIYAALAAFSGHAIRDPFARLLFGGGWWRRLRHV